MLDMSLMKYARVFAFVLLAVVTVYGAYGFFTGDWTSAADFWRSKLPVIPLVALLALLASAAWSSWAILTDRADFAARAAGRSQPEAQGGER